MFITVTEALNLPELQQVTVAAGKKGLDRLISSVNLMEVPDISNYVKEGELLITTMYPIRDDEDLQRELIPMLHSKGVAALALAPLAAGRTIPGFMTRQARDLNFPLLSLPYGTSFDDIINAILRQILDNQTSLLRKNAEINQRFINVLLKGGSLTEIAGMIHGEHNFPVAICSPFGSILAEAGKWNTGTVEKLPIQGIDKETEIEIEGREKSRIWACPISYGGEHYAVLTIALPPGKEGEPEKEMARQASHIIALEITRIHKQTAIEQRFRSTLIENILQGKITSLTRAVSLGKSYGWDLSGSFIPAIIQPDGEKKSPPGAFTSPLQFFTDFARWHSKIKFIAADLSNETLILFPCNTVEPESKGLKELRAVLEDFRSHLRGSTRIGIGRRIKDIIDLPLGVQQAEQAALIAREAENLGRITRFDQLGVYRVLFENSSKEEKRCFLEETLGSIIAEDAKRHSRLIDTLREYFKSGGNLRRTAELLCVHHNTAANRIARIEELSGSSLKENEDQLNLQIALKLLDLDNLQ
jgi:purine catabolism regulator